MHPAVLYGWKRAREWAHGAECGVGCGPSSCASPQDSGLHASHGGGGESPFGVRRPLRFMAHKLDLDEAQVKQLAQILSDIKTERAQAAVDEQRTLSQIAEAVEASELDVAKIKQAMNGRVETARRLADEVQRTLERTHAILKPEQRSKLAYLLRSGWLSI